MRPRQPLLGTIRRIVALGLLGGSLGACSIGDGTGEVRSDFLFAEGCWKGAYDLDPNFFAAVPFRDDVQFRIQSGNDFMEVSDGLLVTVHGVEDIRKNRLNEPLSVTLPAGVSPPGFPEGSLCADGDCSAPVNVTLYLLKSCHSENTVLYGLSGQVTFEELFSGDPAEDDASDKLTEATFDVMVGNPQALVMDGPDRGTIPNQTRITGRFRFFFQRGQPAQPFP